MKHIRIVAAAIIRTLPQLKRQLIDRLQLTTSKKSLLLLSVLGVAAAAHAQSSVTLGGTIDEALNRTTGSLTSKTQLNSGANKASRLYFLGAEDLGGGTYSIFRLSAGLNTSTGVGGTPPTNVNNQPSGQAAAGGGLTFARQAIVGLRGSWGEVRAGRDHAPTLIPYTQRYDVFGVGVGVGLNYIAGLNPSLVRVSNDIRYNTPTFLNGFTVNVQHWLGGNPSGATSNDGTGSGAALAYNHGPYSAIAAYSGTTEATGDVTLRVVSAYYDPGPWKIAFIVNHDTQGSTITQNGYNFGGLVRIGVGTIKASYSAYRTNTGASAGKISVGYVYHLSKNTAWYTTFAHLTNRNGSALAISGATTAPNQSSNGFDIGLRHFF